MVLKKIKSTLTPLAADIIVGSLPMLKSRRERVKDGPLPLKNGYYFTSEKGLHYAHAGGIDRILNRHLYGLDMQGDAFFAAIHLGARSVLLRGNRKALEREGRNFDVKVIYDIETPSARERVHQITASKDSIWAANTGHNSILKIDPEKGEVVQEIFPFTDSFGEPIACNHNHINSVSVYGDVILFAAYRAGDTAMIGVIEGERVTGYAYENKGVHDIYVTPNGFLFCDTFGSNKEGEGGCVVTQDGPFDAKIFEKPPGYIVRGAAQAGSELVIGHSHKGERSKRFKGEGALLVWQDGKFIQDIKIPMAQVYQITREGGRSFDVDESKIKAAPVKALLEKQLGKPVYKGKAVIYDSE